MSRCEVRFLGVDSVVPGPGDDTACLLLDRRLLVDCGWAASQRLSEHGLSPTDLDAVIITHLHHDHYLGLPGILFHRWQRGRDLKPLTILGPAEDLARVVGLATDFLQVERFGHTPRVELVELAPGDHWAGHGVELVTGRSVHPVPALTYRLTHQASGAVITFTGDTAFHEPLAALAAGSDLLVTEASHGAQAMRERPNTHGHSGAPDAAELARLAGVKRLALVHAPAKVRADALAAARAIFPHTFWPQPGEALELPAD